ncbi:hypothetical protein ACWPMX_14940 [Tsuneonella sp. HG094]
MHLHSNASCSYVIKAVELPALNYLGKGHPLPKRLTWINRGTDQDLRPTSVQQLIRTLFHDQKSPSVAKLHETSGLRVSFETMQDRDGFAKAFSAARAEMIRRQRTELSAVFDRPKDAEKSFEELRAGGVEAKSISLLWRAGQFIRENHSYPAGHSRLSVATATVGAGLAGAIFGMTLLTIPGLGLVAAGGAIAAQALGTIGAVGGALGATGGGIARMLTDLDVDDHEVDYFVMEIATGKVFVSVDPVTCGKSIEFVRGILTRNGGHFADSVAHE